MAGIVVMSSARKRRVVLALGAAVIAVLAAAGWTYRRPLAGRWWMWRLGSADAAVRETAARRLGELRPRRAVPLLEEALGDRSQGVRLEAARAIQRIDLYTLDRTITLPYDLTGVEPPLIFAILEINNLRAHQDGLPAGDFAIEYRLHFQEDGVRLRAREIYRRALGKELGSN